MPFKIARFAAPIIAAVLVLAFTTPVAAKKFGFSGLKIHGITTDMAKAMGWAKPEGVMVEDVALGGPGDKAGIRRGDLIISFNKTRIDTFRRMIKVVTRTKPGQAVTLQVIRAGGTVKLSMKMATWPDAWNVTKGSVINIPTFGLTLAAITPKIRERFNIRWGSNGVLITLIDPEFVDQTELKRGDVIVQVNQRDVWKPEQIRDAFDKAKTARKKHLVMLVERIDGYQLMVHKVR